MADLLSGGGGDVRQPDEWNAKEPKVGVDESDGLVEPNARLRGIKLPSRMLRVADGNPAAADEVDVVGETLDLRGLEIERILRNQNQRVGATRDFDGAANVREAALPGAYVVAGFIGFEVLIVVIKTDMAASKGFGGFFVVFDVVGLEALVPVMNVHVIVGDKKFAAFLLRAARPYLDIAAFAGAQADLLGDGNRQRRSIEEKNKRREREKEAERGRNPGMRATIHAEHLIDDDSWIA